MNTQSLYNQLEKHEISAQKFLHEVRRDPQLTMVHPTNSLQDTIAILKRHKVIFEVKDKNPELPEVESLTIDQVSPFQYAKGIEYELKLINLPAGNNLPEDEELKKVQQTVLKNLTSDKYYYTKKEMSDVEKKQEKEKLEPTELKKDMTAPNQMKKGKIIKEIKINNPSRKWFLDKYMPDFDPANIKIGDRIFGIRLGKPYNVKIENIETHDDGDVLFTFDNGQQSIGKQLISQNKKLQLQEIKINDPLKFEKFIKLISDENEDKGVLSMKNWDELIDYMIDTGYWDEDDIPRMYKLMNSNLKENLDQYYSQEGEEYETSENCDSCDREQEELDIDVMNPNELEILSKIIDEWGLIEADMEDSDIMDELADEFQKRNQEGTVDEAIALKDKAGNVQYAKDDSEANNILNQARTKNVQLTKQAV